MAFLLILIPAEILTFIVIRDYFYDRSWMKYYFFTLFNLALSILLWTTWFEISQFRGFYDDPRHVSLKMIMRGALIAIVVPRTILILTHYAGKLTKRNHGSINRPITGTGMAVSLLIFALSTFGILSGRFNFKTEHITLNINGLHEDLNGLKIVHLSDMHLPSFYHHSNRLTEIMEDINELRPDLIINTGDFVNYGWREFKGFDTLLRVAKSRYGNFAVMGNHDFGTYHPHFTEADRKNNVLIMNNMIVSSGYTVLNDEFTVLDIGGARLGLAGVITMGSFPTIIHGDLDKAINGMDSTDLNILMTHDPNHWVDKVKGKSEIELTFSGHTHGMQVGILTKNFRWSPAKYFYPCWGGLYTLGDQFLIVNRGLGVLGLPLRIWMPPEIAVITLKRM